MMFRVVTKGRFMLQPDFRPPRQQKFGLTPRELEISALEARHSNKEIAEHLRISEDAVAFQVSNIYRKLGVGLWGSVWRRMIRFKASPAFIVWIVIGWLVLVIYHWLS